MVHKEIHGNELYVYMNGSLLYKRWLKEGHGRVFEGGFYNTSFMASDVWQHITDKPTNTECCIIRS